MSAGTPTLRVILETECSSGCGGDSSSEQAEYPHEGAAKPRIVRQFTWTERQGVSMMVPVSFGKVSVSAVVDTAAQITVISPDLRRKLKWVKPSNMEQVELCNAQKDAVMMGTLWPHIGFNLGGRKYYCDVIEADIHDLLILGIDFLRGNKCKVDLGNDTLEFGNGDIVHAHMRSDVSASAFHISRLVVRKKLSLPPNSVVYVDAKMESPAIVPFAFEPVDNLAQKKLFMMPGMTQGDKTVQVAVLNLADVHVKLRRNQELAHAVEVDAMLDMKAEKGGKPVLYVREDDQGGMPVPQQYKVCQLRVTGGEHPDVIVEGNEQGDLETETGEDTGCVGGSLRDSESSGYTNSSTSESKSSACYGIGECGLDRTISHMPEQKTNFKKQLKWAMELKKPLVLHLRGKDHKDTLAVYKEALEVAGKVLGRRHAVYLHCFTADYPTFLMWRKRFGNLLVGVTWKTTSTPDFPRLGRGLPLECLVYICCPVRPLRCPRSATCLSRFCWRLATITWPGSLVGCECRFSEGR